MVEMKSGKVVITGGAGLVGQNLIPRLTAKGFTEIVAIDKHPTNVKILEKYHPTIRVLNQDLAKGDNVADAWKAELAGCRGSRHCACTDWWHRASGVCEK